MAGNESTRQTNIDTIFGQVDPVAVRVPAVEQGFDEEGKKIPARGAFNAIDALRSELGQFGIAHKNRFQLNINPPRNITPGGSSTLRRLMIRCNAVTLPGSLLETQSDANIYGPNRDVVSGISYADDVTVRFSLDDKFDVRKYFTDWQKLTYDEDDWNIKYYNDYNGQLDIFVLNRNHKPTAAYRIWEAYPKTVGPVEFDMTSSDAIQDFSVNFAFRFWTDIGEHGSKAPRQETSREASEVERLAE